MSTTRKIIQRIEIGDCKKTIPCMHDVKIHYQDGTSKSTGWENGDKKEKKYWQYIPEEYKKGHRNPGAEEEKNIHLFKLT